MTLKIIGLLFTKQHCTWCLRQIMIPAFIFLSLKQLITSLHKDDDRKCDHVAPLKRKTMRQTDNTRVNKKLLLSDWNKFLSDF